MSRLAATATAFALFSVGAELFAANASEGTVRANGEVRAAGQDVAYLLLDAGTGSVLDSRWPGMNQPVPLGSLVKPFTALAYAQTHGFRYPDFECKGESDGCWLPAGHGHIGIEAGISHSCNVYFRLLAELVNYTGLSAVAWRFGIAAPSPDAPSSSYFGLGEAWQSAPLAMARAYLELVRRQGEPGVAPVLSGMRHSAETGTASGVGKGSGGFPAWAKTGTAPCIHQPASNGDGYAVAIYPAPRPRYVLLIQNHGVPGRLAAVEAGEMLSRLQKPVR